MMSVTLPHFTSPIKWVSQISLRPSLDTRSSRGHSQTEPIGGVCSPFAHPSLNFSHFQSSQLWHLGCFSSECGGSYAIFEISCLSYPDYGFAEHSELSSASGLCQ